MPHEALTKTCFCFIMTGIYKKTKMIKKLAEKVLNVSPPELGRTSYAWILKFLLKVGLIAGWTTIISIFVSKYSVSALPVLFMVQAAMTIAGMLFFSFLVNRIEVRKLAIGSAFAAGILLFLATFFRGNDYVFFPMVLFASGIFLPQLNIFLSNYIEDFFTPSECERTFPAIESAETIGGLIGAIIIANSFLGLENYRIMYVWIILIFAFIGAFFILHPKSPRFYSTLYEMKIIKKDSKVNWDALKKSIGEIKRMRFLQVLVVVFFIQWMLMHLLEFQYVKVVDEGVIGGESLHEESLIRGLGVLQIVFNGSAIVMQFLLASKIIRFIGTFGGFLLHALISFMSAILMMMGFGYFTTIVTKNNFELSGIINKNAYEASYYAFRHSTQRSIREFFEGLVAPTGTIVATLLLLFIQGFFTEAHSLIVINLLLVLLTGFVLYMSSHLQKSYTSMVRENLFNGGNKISRMNAIEILAQKGHIQSIDVLSEVLEKESDPEIKAKILFAFKRIGHIKAIPAIADCLFDTNRKVVLAAISALTNFPYIKNKKSSAIFSRQKVIDDLKSLFAKNEDFEIRSAALGAIARFDENSAAFLLDVLKKSHIKMQAVCIRFMSSFEDPTVAEYATPFLRSDDAFVRAQAIVLIARIKGINNVLKELIEEMIHSEQRNSILAACLILPALRIKSVMNFAEMNLRNDDMEIRLNASVGLLEAGEYKSGLTLADLLLSGNELILSKAKSLTANLKISLKRVISDLLQKEVFKKTGTYNSKMPVTAMLENVDEKLLHLLYESYEILNLDEEKELIRNIIEYRKYREENEFGKEIKKDIVPELISY